MTKIPATLRRLGVFLGVLAAAALVLWWALTRPSDAWYASHTANIETVAKWIIWIGGAAQTAFVLLWATERWHRRPLGRAIMTKSLGIALLLDLSLVELFVPVFPAEEMLGLVVVALVVTGSVYQCSALAAEMWRSWRNGRQRPASLR